MSDIVQILQSTRDVDLFYLQQRRAPPTNYLGWVISEQLNFEVPNSKRAHESSRARDKREAIVGVSSNRKKRVFHASRMGPISCSPENKYRENEYREKNISTTTTHLQHKAAIPVGGGTS